MSKGDLDKMGPALQRMLEEEPTARVERSDTGEQILRAVGEAHVAVITERLKRKFGAAIATRTPTVPYRETIRGTTKAHGRYKKQTGGHGMFGDVWIELEPNPAAGVEFADKVVGGSVPKGFFAGIEKGIRETAAEGVFAGLPADRLQGDALRRLVPPGGLERALVQDRGVDGAQGRRARRRSPSCSSRSWPSRCSIPEQYMGEVNRDLNGRRGRVLGHGPRGRAAGHQRPRPPGGAVLVRDGAAVADRRARDVHLGPRPLRGRAVAPRGEDHRRAQEGRAPRRALTPFGARHGSAPRGRRPGPGDCACRLRGHGLLAVVAILGPPAAVAAFEAIELGGMGNDVARVSIPDGAPAIVAFRHPDDAAFTVEKLAADGTGLGRLVEAPGRYVGTVLLVEPAGGSVDALRVTTTGTWSATIEPPERGARLGRRRQARRHRVTTSSGSNPRWSASRPGTSSTRGRRRSSS